MRRFRALFEFMLALGLAVFLTGCQPPGPKALLKGERLVREGKYNEAVEALKEAVQLLPGHPQAWNYLGLAEQYAGRPEEALRAYQQAVALDRNLAASRFNLGSLHLEQGRLAEAISELTTGTVLDGDYVAGWSQLGLAQLHAKRIDDAEKSFAAVQRLKPGDAESLNYLGVIQLHRRKGREAMAYFTAALKQQPNHGPAVLNQALVHHHYIVNKPAALQKYREYLALKPDAAGLATATEAVRLLEAELAPRPVAVATNAPGTNRLASMTVTNAAVRTNVAVTATNVAPRATNIALGARPSLTRTSPPPAVVNAPPKVTNSPAPLIAEPVVAKAANAPVAAAVVAPPVVTNKPVAEVVVKAPEPPAAPTTNVAAKPVEIAPPVEPPVKLEVVKIAEEPKVAVVRDIAPPRIAAPAPAPKPVPATNAAVAQSAPAAPLIRPVEAEPKSKMRERLERLRLERLNPVDWFRRDKKTEEPAKVAQKVTPAPEPEAKPAPPKPKPEPPEPEIAPFANAPRYPYQTGRLPAPGDRARATPWFNAAFDAHQAKQLGAAIEGYRKALQADPAFFEAHYNLGLVAREAGDLPLALAAHEDAVRLQPASRDARHHFALALHAAHYPHDAVNELREVIVDAPGEARAHLALGNIYAEALRSRGLAEEHYRKVLELEPNHPQAARIRAWLAQQ